MYLFSSTIYTEFCINRNAEIHARSLPAPPPNYDVVMLKTAVSCIDDEYEEKVPCFIYGYKMRFCFQFPYFGSLVFYVEFKSPNFISCLRPGVTL